MQTSYRFAGTTTTGKLFTCVAASLCGLVAASSLNAATIAHYRFEDGDFLADSAGSNHLTSVGTVNEYTLPATGAGSDFPNPIPQTGAPNQQAVQLTGFGNMRANGNSFTGLTDFTFEGFFNLTATSTSTQYLGGQLIAQNGRRSWAIGVASSGGTGTAGANELFALLSANGTANTIVPLGLTVVPGTDYYVAFAFDGDTDTNDVQFSYQNLTDGDSLVTNSISSGIETVFSVTTATPLEIGSYSSDGSRFNGIIDEVRISDTTLSQSELLVVIPEPASLSLLGLGVLGLLRRRRVV